MQVDSELSFILNFILELLQTFCLHRFFVFGRRDALQIQRSDDRTAMSISLEGFFLALKTLSVLLDQKNRLAVRVVGQFFSVISMQTRWWRKDVRGGVYLVQPNVNNEEHRLRRNFPAIRSTKGS